MIGRTNKTFSLIVCILAALIPATAPGQSPDTTAPAASLLPDNPSPAVSPTPPPPTEAPQPLSSSSETQPLTYAPPDSQVTILENTPIRVMTDQPLSSRQSKDGAPVLFTLSEDVVADNVIVIPRGAIVHGEVIDARKAGVLTGAPELTLKLVSLDLDGQTYPLYTYQFKVRGASKTKPTETKIKGGAVIGAIVGGVFSGSARSGPTAVGKLAGLGTGAALGAGVGAMTSAATPGPILSIPAESQMEFQLAAPMSIHTVSPKEAARLARGLRPGGPVLYVRGDTP